MPFERRELINEFKRLGDGNFTLIIQKPHEFKEHVRKLIDTCLSMDGLERRYERRGVQLTNEDVWFLYHHHGERDFFEANGEYVKSAPVDIAIVVGDDAVNKWRKIIGRYDDGIYRADDVYPNATIRAFYGSRSIPHENAVHGSSDTNAAMNECLYFFSY